MPDRLRQIAEHEIRFREINERLAEDVRGVTPDDVAVEFVCECGVLSCTATVAITLPAYDAIRADGAHFAILPGHEIPDAEDVVAEESSHWVVRKHESTAPLARQADPRS